MYLVTGYSAQHTVSLASPPGLSSHTASFRTDASAGLNLPRGQEVTSEVGDTAFHYLEEKTVAGCEATDILFIHRVFK